MKKYIGILAKITGFILIVIAALYTAAERGVQVQILIDGIYQKLFLEKSPVFQALAAHQNVEVGIYNPVMNRKVKGKETK